MVLDKLGSIAATWMESQQMLRKEERLLLRLPWERRGSPQPKHLGFFPLLKKDAFTGSNRVRCVAGHI
jgi:hypothetical protein